eukprot:5639951-Pleurochrysis_carterae.AAC.1
MEESCSRAASSSPCIAVSASRAELSSRWAVVSTSLRMTSISASELDVHRALASACRAAVSRARI